MSSVDPGRIPPSLCLPCSSHLCCEFSEARPSRDSVKHSLQRGQAASFEPAAANLTIDRTTAILVYGQERASVSSARRDGHLSRREILRRLQLPVANPASLVVTPLLRPEQALDEGSLAREFIKLPYDVSGQILTKSSVARTFIVVETAPWIHPLYRGCLTLEIANVSNTPLLLYPGRSIAQLVLLAVRPRPRKRDVLEGKYVGPVFPEAAQFDEPWEDLQHIGISETWQIPAGKKLLWGKPQGRDGAPDRR